MCIRDRSADYEDENIELLTRLTLSGEGGTAVLLEQSSEQIEQLRSIVLAVSQGEVIFDPALLDTMSADRPIYQFLRRLSTTELDILSLLSKGHTNSSIAETLHMDTRTVKQYINSIYGRLRAETRAQAWRSRQQ